jgi:hypothetical protein
MIGLSHDISNLCPTHPILECHLIRWLAHDRCFHLLPSHIAKHWTAHRIFVLSLPPSTPHHQAHQRQDNDNHCRHRCSHGYAQHLTVNFTLGSIVAADTRTHLGARIVVRTSASIVAKGVGTGVALSTGPLLLVGPWITQPRLAFTTETAPYVSAQRLWMAIV